MAQAFKYLKWKHSVLLLQYFYFHSVINFNFFLRLLAWHSLIVWEGRGWNCDNSCRSWGDEGIEWRENGQLTFKFGLHQPTMMKQNSVDIEDEDESQISTPSTSYNEIFDICGYIGPTLVCGNQVDSNQSYLEVLLYYYWWSIFFLNMNCVYSQR